MMNMKLPNKGISTIWGVIIVVIAGIVAVGIVLGYQSLWQPKEETPGSAPATEGSKSTQTVNWEGLLPDIEKILKEKDMTGNYSVEIGKKADITGDGVEEALVATGMCGASTCFSAVFQLENNKPALSVFKMEDGRIITNASFGEGGSVTHQDNIDFWPEKQAVYAFGYGAWPSQDYKKEYYFEAYQWDSRNGLFAYDKELSEEVRNLPEVQKFIKQVESW